jgi:hypothetical protein
MIISASVWLFKKESITMHGNINVKVSDKLYVILLYNLTATCFGSGKKREPGKQY